MNKDFPVPEFFKGYLSFVEEEEVYKLLVKDLPVDLDFFHNIPEDKLDYRYAEGKWSVKEVLQHITDTERIMAYRALRFARADHTPLPGFEQDDYVRALKIDDLGKEEIIDEWESVRKASIILFRNFHPSLMAYEGTASDKRLNVELLGRIIIGHTRHHLHILNEKYLK